MVWWYEVEGDIRPLSNDILVEKIERGPAITSGGIYLMDDIDLKENNIKHRWAKVYKVGKNVDYVKPGEWVLIECGRWSRGIRIRTKDGKEHLIHKVDPDGILLKSDYKPGPKRIELGE